MKNKFIIGLGVGLAVVVIIALIFSNSGELFQGQLRTNLNLTTTESTTQTSVDTITTGTLTDQDTDTGTISNLSTKTPYILSQDAFQDCQAGSETENIVLTSNDSAADFANFASKLSQELNDNGGITKCNYTMYVTDNNNIGDIQQDHIEVHCLTFNKVESSEIFCSKIAQDNQKDVNFFNITMTPTEAVVRRHSTYGPGSIKDVQYFNTYWIEQLPQ